MFEPGNIINISSAKLLPSTPLYGPMSQEEFEKVTIKGRAFRLVHQYPKRYIEYFIEPVTEKGIVNPI